MKLHTPGRPASPAGIARPRVPMGLYRDPVVDSFILRSLLRTPCVVGVQGGVARRAETPWSSAGQIPCTRSARKARAKRRADRVYSSEGEYETFIADKQWLPHGQYDTPGLVRLMASRRSCRNFIERTMDRALLDDLVKIGITAPSGTNCQLWTFTVIPTRKAVISFAGHIASFFSKS